MFDNIVDNQFSLILACSAVGALAGLMMNDGKVVERRKAFIRNSVMSVVFGIVAGILCKRFVIDESEIVCVFAAIGSMFAIDISKEVREILDNVSELFNDAAKKSIDKKFEDENKNEIEDSDKPEKDEV